MKTFLQNVQRWGSLLMCILIVAAFLYGWLFSWG
jgi:hypothetical protein